MQRVTSSWLAIASGLSIGREGPLIEFGGSLGAAIGRVARLPLARTRVLVAAGTAAGFAAAYNTPFAAVLFVLETIVGIAALEAVIPTDRGNGRRDHADARNGWRRAHLRVQRVFTDVAVGIRVVPDRGRAGALVAVAFKRSSRSPSVSFERMAGWPAAAFGAGWSSSSVWRRSWLP